MVPDRILGWQDHLWCHGLPCLTPRKIPWKFRVNILNKCVKKGGVLHGGTWRTLRAPERRLGWQGHPWCNGWHCLTQRKITWKFHVDIFIRSISRMKGPSWGYLEVIESSWHETWRTRSSMIPWMYFVDPQDHILKVSSPKSFDLTEL